jgi:hypothetical protein
VEQDHEEGNEEAVWTLEGTLEMVCVSSISRDWGTPGWNFRGDDDDAYSSSRHQPGLERVYP